MQAPVSTPLRSRSRLFRAACAGVLLLHLAAGTPSAPLFAALLAAVDRGHEVVLQQAADGLQVVLHHGGAHPAWHRHGLLARVLASFAARDATPHSDHVLQFGLSPNVSAAPLDLSSAPPAPAEMTGGEAAGAGFQVSPNSAHELRWAFARPPPRPAGSLLAVRFIVLLL